MGSSGFVQAVCSCGERLLARRDQIGQKVTCPSCLREFIIADAVAKTKESKPETPAPKPTAPSQSAPDASSPQPIPGFFVEGAKRKSKLRRWINSHDEDNTLRLTALSIVALIFIILAVGVLRSPLVSGRRDRRTHPPTIPAASLLMPSAASRGELASPLNQPAPTSGPATVTVPTPQPPISPTSTPQTQQQGSGGLPWKRK